MNIKKDLINVILAKLLNLIVGIVLGFIVPIYLNVEQYGYLSTFLFYISYIGIFHLGFVDGIYIKYGGKNLKDLNSSLIKFEHNFLIKIEFIISVILGIIAIFSNNKILTTFSLSIIPLNMISFYRYIYEATGELKKAVKISNFLNTFILIMNLSLIFIFNIRDYKKFIVGYLITYYVVFVLLELLYKRENLHIPYEKNILEIKYNFKVGMFFLLGNLATSLFYSIDRWITKSFLSIEDFAYYSFAISIIGVINIFINSISLTLYSYLARYNNLDKIKLLKTYLLILGMFSIGSYFIFDGIVSLFITKYNTSISISKILFLSLPYSFIINILYINLYKAKKLEKKYCRSVVTMILISCILNLIAFNLSKTIYSIAIATTISSLTWYIYSLKDFNYLKPNIKEVLYMIVLSTTFLITTNKFNWYLGFLIYFSIFFTITIAMFKLEIKKILNMEQ